MAETGRTRSRGRQGTADLHDGSAAFQIDLRWRSPAVAKHDVSRIFRTSCQFSAQIDRRKHKFSSLQHVVHTQTRLGQIGH